MGYRYFQVDHYRPKSLDRFKHLITEYSNLLYTCDLCNNLKSSIWPSDDPLTDGIGWLDPCEHNLEEHYCYNEEENYKLIYFTDVGKWMTIVLALDHPTRIEKFREIVKMQKLIKNFVDLSKEKLDQQIALYRENPTEKLAREIEKYRQAIQEAENKLENWYKPKPIDTIQRSEFKKSK